MDYRRATIVDADAIARVHVAAWRSTYPGIIPTDFLNNLTVEGRAGRWRQAFAEPWQETPVFVAEQAEVVVGFASGGPERENNPRYKGELYAIYLLKEVQGHGVGRYLVHLVARTLLDQGTTSMLVWVLAENPARKFYEALGGQYLREKLIEIGNATLTEVAYGWNDINLLFLDREEK